MGDIHGRLDLMDRLTEQIASDNAPRGRANVTVILLGDLIDRGPDSARVVERAIGWREEFASLQVLLGNHEASLVSVLNGDTGWLASWLTYGGRETLTSYGVAPGLLRVGSEDEIVAATREKVPAAHREWLETLPLSIEKGGYWFVHAGIQPGKPLAEQEAEDLLWIREKFLNSRTDHGAVVVHGHSIADEIEERPNRIGMDTGAFFSDTLSAVGLEGEDRWFLQT